MNLEELREDSKIDLAIDTLRIESEAARNPVLYGKWLDRMMAIKYERLKLNNTLKKLTASKANFYTGKGPGKVSQIVYDKTELRMVMPGDEEMIKAQSALDLCELKIELCQEVLRAINSRQFAIKHVIDQRRLEAGG